MRAGKEFFGFIPFFYYLPKTKYLAEVRPLTTQKIFSKNGKIEDYWLPLNISP